ncbi:MAG: NAD-dependent epimerase/dehydratase family protein [Candidatus Kapaibacterium sp.]|nr:NAD-dependent epimerase/dehydratase family protein [Candidatus Kapabacteria bacterium]
MNVLLTGGSGFLGKHLIKEAEISGHNIFAPRSNEFNLLTGFGIEEYFAKLNSENKHIDAIIHSAAYYGGIGINRSEPATIFYKNCQMATNIFEIAKNYKVKKILPIGSACSYPGHIIGDLHEADFWNGELHSSVEAYGISKKLQQVAQRAYYNQYKIESNHLVLTNLYGPYDVFTEYRSHVVSAMIKKFADAKIHNKQEVILWGDGSPIREFLYVGDAAKVIIKTLNLPHDTTPINIGTGIGTTIKELAELIAEITGFEGQLVWDTEKPNGVARKVLNIERMKNLVQYTPETNLRSGLKSTIEWYLANKELADLRN